MIVRKDQFNDVGTVVVKIGTSSITAGKNTVSSEFMDSIAKQVKALKDEGKNVLIVSSGAIGVGLAVMKAKPKPNEIPIRQAAASVGQGILMQKWNDSFGKVGLIVSQILLTYDFYSDREKYLNLRNAIKTLFEYNVVPIINENDVVCVKEIDATFGDNDTLSAYVSAKIDADLLIIISDVDGLYDKNPKIYKDAKLIHVVEKLDEEIKKMGGSPTSKLGVGGMKTKLEAADICSKSGCNMVIASSVENDVLTRILKGENVGTLFVHGLKERKKLLWIRSAHSLGKLVVDEGGFNALKKHMGLLSAGIKGMEGVFEKGDVVDIVCNDIVIAKGITNYNSDEVSKIKGQKSDRIEKILGHKSYNDVITNENIVLL